MSLLSRQPVRIGRAEREYRDDRLFLVATDDTYAPRQYFEGLSFSRVRVAVIANDGSAASSPLHVVERMKEVFDEVRKDARDEDEFWVLLDTDHNVKGSHLGNLTSAMQKARQAGFFVAMSNPCFDLWLLLHHEAVPAGGGYGNYPEIEARLREVLGSYNKTNIGAGRFPLALVDQAIERARALESNPDKPEGDWPAGTGSRVYLLLERILGRRVA
jgi:hypothetical protein